MGFADTLRNVRLNQFLSQAELARRAGLHPLTVTRLEAGASAPSTRTVRALAEALGVRPGELATPGEVAELRRVLGRGRRSPDADGERLDRRSDDAGSAAPEPTGHAD